MFAYLWLRGANRPPPPLEYIEFVLCERFHKLPSEVRREPFTNIELLLSVMAVESSVQASEKKVR